MSIVVVAIKTLTAIKLIRPFNLTFVKLGFVSCAKDIDKCPYSNIKLLN
jgi:hypothetical protein